MTNEEAIEILKAHHMWTGEPQEIIDVRKENKALEMAIQALSQESEIEENIIKYMKKYPNHVGNIDFWEGFYACRNVVLQLDDEECSPKEQEPCDDAVSRQAVLDEINRIGIKAFETYTDYSQLYDFVDTLPPVTQKSRTGHWIEPQQDDGMSDPIYYQVRCSECGFGLDPQTWYTELHQYGADNYCPNCGAKMVEPQEKRCEDCNHYGKLSLDCARCDDDCSMYEPQESEE